MSQFNPSLASEVVYKAQRKKPLLTKQPSSSAFEGQTLNQDSSNFENTVEELSAEEVAAVTIQKCWRGFVQRVKYSAMLIEKFEALEEAREVEEKRRIERWMVERETEMLKRKIEERNRLFSANLNYRIQAAIVIQRYFRSYLRLKRRGISTTQILERKKIEEEYGGEMPTALMQKLLEKDVAKVKTSQVWCLDSAQFDEDLSDQGPADASFSGDSVEADDAVKIPKKT